MRILGISIIALAVMGGAVTVWNAFALGFGWSLIAICGCVAVGLAGTGLIERSMR